jgi:hypothetical protein|tara:strand:- start:249 stop:605 length:357 start_codon:yes stop_codon:yes gene_type:complete
MINQDIVVHDVLKQIRRITPEKLELIQEELEASLNELSPKGYEFLVGLPLVNGGYFEIICKYRFAPDCILFWRDEFTPQTVANINKDKKWIERTIQEAVEIIDAAKDKKEKNNVKCET